MKKIYIILFILSIITIKGQVPSYVPTTSLTAWYSFSGNANDLSGNNNNGIAMNGASLTADRNSVPNSAYSFDGIDDFIVVNGSPAFVSDSLTLSFWINSTQNYLLDLIEFGSNSSATWGATASDDWVEMAVGRGCSGGGTSYTQTAIHSTGAWHHFALVLSKNTHMLYKNGVYVGSCTKSQMSTLSCSTQSLYIGSAIFTSQTFFNGLIDDFGIWSRSLSDCEIYKLYNAGISPVTTSTSNSIICSGQSATLTATGASTFTWSPGNIVGSTIVVSPTTSTSYSVTGTSTAGCTSSSAVANITVNATPSITVNSGTICSGQSFTINPIGANTYTYTGGSAVVSPTTNTSYSVTGTSTAGCVSVLSAVSNITVTPLPNANAGTSQTITCSNPTVNLNGSGVSTFTWSGPGIVSGINSSNCIVNVGGTYTLTGSTSGCNNANTATVSVNTSTTSPNLIISITPTISAVCLGASANLSVTGANTYTWSTGSNSMSIVVTPTASINYSVAATNTANGCTGISSQSVIVNLLPLINVSSSSSVVCGPPFQGTVTLTSGGASTYTWNTSANGSTIAVSPSVTTSYTVTGTDANGCINTNTISQTVSACTGFQNFSQQENNILLFPNPATNILNIETTSNIKIDNVVVLDITGRKVLEQKENITQINIQSLEQGMYQLLITSEGKNYSSKFIKE